MEKRISTLEGKVSEYDRTFDMMREDIRGVYSRIEETNARIDDLRSDIDKRIDDLRSDMDRKIDDTNKRIEGMDIRINTRIDSNFKWMLGIQIAMWITIITAILL